MNIFFSNLIFEHFFQLAANLFLSTLWSSRSWTLGATGESWLFMGLRFHNRDYTLWVVLLYMEIFIIACEKISIEYNFVSTMPSNNKFLRIVLCHVKVFLTKIEDFSSATLRHIVVYGWSRVYRRPLCPESLFTNPSITIIIITTTIKWWAQFVWASLSRVFRLSRTLPSSLFSSSGCDSTVKRRDFALCSCSSSSLASLLLSSSLLPPSSLLSLGQSRSMAGKA